MRARLSSHPSMLTEPIAGFAPLALIVDRDDDSRQMYTDFLELNQWRVITAAGGPEALAKAIAERPDVVVSETLLPGFGGVMLSELLRRDCSTAHIPIVFVTSDATAANLAKAVASGAQAVLTKPCLPDALLKAIDAAFHQSQERRERATAAQVPVRTRIGRARNTFERAGELQAAAMPLKKALQRGDTLVPPMPPPALRCPECGDVLKYLRSHVGGVSVKHLEQWDYFECPRRCGTFEYRSRTRKLRPADR
jgi:two-component system, cell cycle response regulator DivK